MRGFASGVGGLYGWRHCVRQDAVSLPPDFTLLQVVPELETGGAEQSTLDVAHAVVRAGGKALVLIAPAPDFTEKLMAPGISPADRKALAETGVWLRPSDYGDPYPISRELLEDGARWSILPGPVPVTCPVRILQGGADPDVPWRHALELANALTSEDVVFSLTRDGDHRLSRPQDLARLIAALDEVA